MGPDNPPVPWQEFERRLSWHRPGPYAGSGPHADGSGDAGGSGAGARHGLRGRAQPGPGVRNTARGRPRCRRPCRH